MNYDDLLKNLKLKSKPVLTTSQATAYKREFDVVCGRLHKDLQNILCTSADDLVPIILAAFSELAGYELEVVKKRKQPEGKQSCAYLTGTSLGCRTDAQVNFVLSLWWEKGKVIGYLNENNIVLRSAAPEDSKDF